MQSILGISQLLLIKLGFSCAVRAMEDPTAAAPSSSPPSYEALLEENELLKKEVEALLQAKEIAKGKVRVRRKIANFHRNAAFNVPLAERYSRAVG